MYFADGSVCQLDSDKYAAALLEGVMPDSAIPARYHLHTQTFLPAGDPAESSPVADGLGYRKTVFPSKRPSSRWAGPRRRRGASPAPTTPAAYAVRSRTQGATTSGFWSPRRRG